jgi:MerR family transcriptional regulator, thiopeptide resistance regulator
MGTWKVGALAEQTGLTVRTLHHYDESGLLSPSARTDAGHRLYTDADVQRLQQITSLRSLGFGLDQIRDLLQHARLAPLDIIRMHAARLREQIARQQQIVERLDALTSGFASRQSASVDDLMAAIKEMTMFEKYYTPEQLEYLKQRAETVGAERMSEVGAEWPRLIAEVRAEMEKGTDPSEPRVQELARRWNGLVEEFTGGDAGIRQSLANLYREESQVQGMDVAGMRPVAEYIARASAAGR